MMRIVSPFILCSVIVLFSDSSRLCAETIPAKAAYPGADLFQKGWKYDQGLGTPIDMREAIRFYREAAAAVHPLAKARLARIYFSGNGVEEDPKQAERLSKGICPDVLKAAEKGDAVAQAIIGTMYADGLGVARDSEEALQWLRKAAAQKLPLAQANLGVMYEHGIGVKTDYTEAAKWFRKAADQNNAMGQAYLGDLYKEGRGVPPDECEAARLYGLSAAQNYAHAQTNLCYLYEHGCGVEWDPCEAVRLYRAAAEQGFAVAQANLGTMYEKGCGVEQDVNEAVYWYRRAAAQGDKHAIKALECLCCDY
jgi:uncharacterized protein